MRLALVAVAGAAGAASRYVIGVRFGVPGFPWATLAVNVAGCVLLGLVLGAVGERAPGPLVVAATVGYLGAFTTFSTFAYETITLVRLDRAPAALGYVALSVGLGLAAATVGYLAGANLLAAARP